MGLNRNLGNIPEVITVSGTNIGIGNQSATRKLEVASDGSNWISGTFSGTGGTSKAVIGNLVTPTIGGHNTALNAWSDFTVAGVNINFAPYGNTSVRVLDTGGIKFFDGTLTGTGGFELTSEAGFGARFQSGNYRFMAANNSSEYVRISSTGNMSIGTQTDNGYKLNVNGSISSTSLSLSGNFNATVPTNSGWTSYQTLISPGTLTPYKTYMISIWWHFGAGSNQPYYYTCSFLWSGCSTNGNGTDNEFTPIGATHTGGTGASMSFRSIGAAQSTTGIQARLNGFATTGGDIYVRATIMQGF